MVLLVCRGSGWLGSSVVAELTCIDLIGRRLMTGLEPAVNLPARADATDINDALDIVDHVKHPPVAHTESPESLKAFQRLSALRARVVGKPVDAAANVRAKRLGDAVQPTFRALADDDGVGHRLTASEPLPCDFPGDRPFPSGPPRRFDIGALFAQKADAGLDRHIELSPRTCATNLPSGSAEKAGADRADDLVTRPTEHNSRLVEVQEPARTKRALDGPPTRQNVLDGERGAGGVLPVDVNPGLSTRHRSSSLARVGADFAQGPNRRAGAP